MGEGDDTPGFGPSDEPFDAPGLFDQLGGLGGLGDLGLDPMDELDDLDEPTHQPLPLDDRLWRHPSELARAPVPAPTPLPEPPRPRRRRGRLEPAWTDRSATARMGPLVLAAFVGALLAGAISVLGDAGGSSDADAGPSTTLVSLQSAATLRSAPTVAQLVEETRHHVVTVTAWSATGTPSRASGVVLRSEGQILTARRVVADGGRVTVQVGGAELPARILGSDPDTGIALLHVDGLGLEPPTFTAEGDAPDLGEPVVTVTAAPDPQRGATVTAGVVAGVERTMADPGSDLMGLIEVDRPVPPEGLGAPMVDANGAVMGIAVGTPTGSSFGFAVPTTVAREIAAQLLSRGRVEHAWLGLEGTDSLTPVGAGIRRVKPGSPAAKAQLVAGDVVIRLGDHPVTTMAGLTLALRELKPGTSTRLVVVRDGVTHDVPCVVVDRPE